MSIAVFRREALRTLRSPLYWGLLSGQAALLGWIFLRVVEAYAPDAAPPVVPLTQRLALEVFGLAGALALLAAPLLTLNGLAGEWRDRSYDLLAAAPLSPGQILRGKYLGALLPLALSTLIPLTLTALLTPWADLDWGWLAAATLGLLGVEVLFTALGLWCSSLTRHPALAAALAYGIAVLASLLNHHPGPAPFVGDLMDWLTWNEHYMPFLQGRVQTADLAYFLILAGLLLALTWRRLAHYGDRP